MLNFTPVTHESSELLRNFYKDCKYESCEYSCATKIFWNKFYHYEYSICADCLIIKYSDGENTVFEMPVPHCCEENKEIIDKQIDLALDEIDLYCSINEIIPVFSDIPKDELSRFTSRYNYMKIENSRESQDYVYNVENLKLFKGRHYAGQRNHINKFISQYPDYKFRELTPGEKLDEFWNEFYANFNKNDLLAIREKVAAINIIKNCDPKYGLFAGCIEVENKVIALSAAEICSDRIIIHVEKALTKYSGIYPLIVSEFLKHFAGKNVKWVNREEDASDRGLRISKLQYRPDKLIYKYILLPHSELFYLDEIPMIKTDRLTLTEIRECDIDAYRKLCLDDERNKLWGYDFREDYKGDINNIPADYFYEIAKSDFERRICLSFAIRLNDAFIGEAVLYQADLKGSIELGCRILSEYSGNKYGTEAFEAASRWAIFDAGFRKVVAKCYKNNSSSYQMITNCMKLTDQDDNFYYFERIY